MVEPILAAQDTWFSQGGTTVKRTSITQIEIKDTYTPTGTVTSSWDASAAKDGSVMAYVEGTKLTIAGNGSGMVYANPDSTAAFSSTGSDYFSKLATFTNGNLLDTSKVTNMKDMFRLATSLKTVDVSNWDTSKVTSMYRTFSGSEGNPMALQSLDVSNWDTSKVTTMRAMFQRCDKLKTLDVSAWDTGEVTTMRLMFGYCSSLEALDVSKWDTGNVNSMEYMFTDCRSLSGLDVSKWNTAKVTTMAGMFYHCTSLTELDVAPKVVNSGTANEYTAWDVSKVTAFNSMFSGNDNAGDMKFTSLAVENWNTSSATNMSHMFYGCGQMTELDLSKWDVSKVTDMTHMFADCFKMTSYDFTGWNTASLTTVDGMFNDNRALVSIDVSDWDTGKIQDFDQLFENCSNLQNINGLNKWNLSAAKYFVQTFKGCSSLTELDLSSWNTSSVTEAIQMFDGCSNLATIYASNKWNLSNIKEGTKLVDGVQLGYGEDMFKGCTKLVGGAGTAHDVSHVDYDYAHIDGGSENPGYLTDIDDPTQMLIQTGTLHKLGISVRGVTGDTSKYSPSDMNAALKDVRSEVTTQADLIEQITSALEGKVAGGSSEPTLQDKTVTPTTSSQTITADSGYDGLDTVTVNAIPNTYVKPASTKDATIYTPTTSNQTISAGTYCSGTQTIKGDANLIPANIVRGKTIFGVAGSADGGGNTDIEDALIDGSITTYSNDRVTSLKGYAFYEAYNLTSVDFPNCEEIGGYAFCYSGLQTANFPACTTIYEGAFESCTSLVNVNFPSCSHFIYTFPYTSLETINLPACAYLAATFMGNENLTSVYLGSDSYEGDEAIISVQTFAGCVNLTNLTLYYPFVATLDDFSAFAETPMLDSSLTGEFGSIYVPASLVEDYKSADIWSEFADRITAIVE